LNVFHYFVEETLDLLSKTIHFSFWLAGWLAGWLASWLAGCWLASWLAGCWMAGSLACWSLNRDLESQGQKVIKSKFLVLILLTSGAKVRNSSNRYFWE